MGTMIQRLRLTEADYRGERFRDHPRDLRNNADLTTLMTGINEHLCEYLESGSFVTMTKR